MRGRRVVDDDTEVNELLEHHRVGEGGIEEEELFDLRGRQGFVALGGKRDGPAAAQPRSKLAVKLKGVCERGYWRSVRGAAGAGGAEDAGRSAQK